MTNKLLSYSSFGMQALILILLAVFVFGGSSGKVLGGMTNFNSLTLQPETASDNAFVVKNSAGTTQLTVYGSGGLLISGTSTFSAAVAGVSTSSLTSLTVSGDTRLFSPVFTGASSSATLYDGATSSITATQACDSSLVNVNPPIAATVATTTLPTVSAMFADCLTANGDDVTVFVRNLSASTTVIAVGSASTTIAIDNGGTVTLGALGSAKITFVRFADNLMWAFVSVFKP